MVSSSRILAVWLLSAVVGPAAGAQATGTVRGTVTDSATGAPVAGARVAAWCAGCALRHPTDSAGRYVIAGVTPGTVGVEFHCPSRAMLGRNLARREVAVAAGADAVVDVRVPPGACAEPPYGSRTGVFRGHYTPGFESSAFVPCPDSALGLAAGLLPGEHVVQPTAWAVWAPAARARRVRWPRAPRDEYGNPTYYVVWRGTLTGPGMYGHLGVSAFEFRVDSVLAVRAPRGDDCRAR